MKLDLTPYRVVIFVFGMPECPACENYVPRLIERVQQWNADNQQRGTPPPFQVVTDEQAIAGVALQPGVVPIIFLDVSSTDKAIDDLANRCHVQATPSTVLMVRGPGTYRVDGALPTGHIDQILQAALDRR